MFDCKGCFKSKTLKTALSKFPIKSKVYRLKARNAGLFKETELKEVTNTIINNLDKSFQIQIFEIQNHFHCTNEEDTNIYPERLETFNSEICHEKY